MNASMRKLALLLAVAAGCSTTGSGSRDTTAGTAGTGSTTGSQASTGGSAGQDPLMQPGPAVKGHAEDRVVSGQVGQVSAGSLVVQSDQGDARLLEIVPETAVTLDGREATYAELQQGQPVRASFSNVEGHDVAVEIHASSLAGSSAGGLGTSGPGTPDASSGTGSSAPSDPSLPPPDSSLPPPALPPDTSLPPPSTLPGPDSGSSSPGGSTAPEGGTGSSTGSGSSGSTGGTGSSSDPTTLPR
jgi:hypothetical protein